MQRNMLYAPRKWSTLNSDSRRAVFLRVAQKPSGITTTQCGIKANRDICLFLRMLPQNLDFNPPSALFATRPNPPILHVCTASALGGRCFRSSSRGWKRQMYSRQDVLRGRVVDEADVLPTGSWLGTLSMILSISAGSRHVY